MPGVSAVWYRASQGATRTRNLWMEQLRQPVGAQVEVLAPPALIIMATDGLWDVTSAEKVVEVASVAYRAGRKDPCRIAEALMRHAQDCRTRDDVTVTVIAWEPQAWPA